MKFHKITLLVSCLLVSSVAAADSFQVEWNLKKNGVPYPVDQKFPTSFNANGMKCELGRSIKMASSQDGSGLVESRTLVCKRHKQEELNQEIRCDRKQVENFLEYGELYLSCNVK